MEMSRVGGVSSLRVAAAARGGEREERGAWDRGLANWCKNLAFALVQSLKNGAHLVAAEAAVPSGFATASKRSPTSLHAIHRQCHASQSFSVPGRFVSTKTTTFRMIWSLI